MKTLTICSAVVLAIGSMVAQTPAVQAPNAGRPNAPAGNTPRVGGFIPGQQRPAGDAAQVERGGKVYSVACRALPRCRFARRRHWRTELAAIADSAA